MENSTITGGGYNDLRQGVIRVLHSISFVDDPTRMLRAVRFEQRFGFQIEDRTLELIRAALEPQDSADQPLLGRVSGDRIRHELDYMLAEPKAPEMFTRLDELGLLHAIHPDLSWDDRVRSWFAALPENVPGLEWGLGPDVKGIPITRAVAYTIWLGQLPPAGVGRVFRRLKLPQALEAIIQSASRLKEEDSRLWNAAPSVITARLDQFHPLALYVHSLTCEEAAARVCLTRYITQWQHVHPQMDGHALRAKGLAPGPVYAKILSRLRAAWLDGEVSSVEEEEKLVAEFLNQTQA